MEQQQQQNDNGKIKKKYEAALAKLNVIMEGTQLLAKAPKVNGADVSALILELAKEEKEALGKQFKTEAISLIQEKRKFDAYIIEANKKLNKEIEEKQKEFTSKAEKLFALMEKAENIEKDYAKVLGAAEDGVNSQETEE